MEISNIKMNVNFKHFDKSLRQTQTILSQNETVYGIRRLAYPHQSTIDFWFSRIIRSTANFEKILEK